MDEEASADLQRWRGEVNAKLGAIEKNIEDFSRSCTACRSSQNGSSDRLWVKLDGLETRLRKVEVQVFGAALAGGIVGAIGSAFVSRILG